MIFTFFFALSYDISQFIFLSICWWGLQFKPFNLLCYSNAFLSDLRFICLFIFEHQSFKLIIQLVYFWFNSSNFILLFLLPQKIFCLVEREFDFKINFKKIAELSGYQQGFRNDALQIIDFSHSNNQHDLLLNKLMNLLILVCNLLIFLLKFLIVLSNRFEFLFILLFSPNKPSYLLYQIICLGLQINILLVQYLLNRQIPVFDFFQRLYFIHFTIAFLVLPSNKLFF